MKTWEVQAVEVDECRLRGTVEEILSRSMGRTVAVRGMERVHSPFATLAPADILTVTIGEGERIWLFLKHIGEDESGHPEKSWCGREIRVYEDLLAGEGLPVPKYYGSSWNPQSNRHELFLEYIDGWNLKYQALDHWFLAARRLARLHAELATQRQRLVAADYLLKLDHAYFRDWADRAFSAVAGASVELAARLAPILARYDDVASCIAEQPPTLVHNDPSPKNVVADVSANPARVCFIDWEMAGAGCGLLDLVHLKYGLDADSDHLLCAAYFDELRGCDMLPRRPGQVAALLAACALHKSLHRLAHCPDWGFGPEKMVRFVAEAENHHHEFRSRELT